MNGTNQVSRTRRTASSDDLAFASAAQAGRQSLAVPASAPGPTGAAAGLLFRIPHDDRSAGRACDSASSCQPGKSRKAVRCSFVPAVAASAPVNTDSARIAPQRNGRTGDAKSQFGLRVAISVQFRSRDRVLRANVQISVTAATVDGSPSTVLPSASRVTLI